MRGMFLLYEALLYLVFVMLLPLFLMGGFLRGKYRGNFRERYGRYGYPAASHDMWLHAVSVGEVAAARPVVARLLERRPDLRLVVTTTTVTGQQQARRNFPNATVTYFPFDFSRSVRRFLRHHQPRALVVIETEIWPNVSRHSAESGMPVLLINGRISDRSFPRYKRVRRFLRPILRLYRVILVRESQDRDRFIAIGADPRRVEVAGNVKFDYEPDPAPLPFEEALRSMAAGAPIVVLGSTVETEDEVVLPVVEAIVRDTDAVVVLAPRKPERFEFVAGMLSAASVPFVRRSEWSETPPGTRVVLLDSIGELARTYRLATAAFIGGSLVPGTGGHNPIEAAAVGIPVLFGPHMSNFREIARAFLTAGAAVQVADADALEQELRLLIGDPGEARRRGALATHAVAASRGAADRMAEAVLEALA